MLELLSLPRWNTGSTPLSEWIDAFAKLEYEATIEKDSPESSWVEVAALNLKGYAVMDGLSVEAINFELSDQDPDLARTLIDRAAESIGWEVHEETENEDDNDNDDA